MLGVPIGLGGGAIWTYKSTRATSDGHGKHPTRPWDGHGECPIADPFGDGLPRLNEAIAYAQSTDDLPSVLCLYDFMVGHVDSHFVLNTSTVRIHSGGVKEVQCFPLYDAWGIWCDRCADIERAIVRGDRRYTCMHLAYAPPRAVMTFAEKRYGQPIEWVFEFGLDIKQ